MNEARRVHNEMGKSGKCHFCDFSCEPNLDVPPCTLAGSYSEGATLSQFIILTKKRENICENSRQKRFLFNCFILFNYLLIINM